MFVEIPDIAQADYLVAGNKRHFPRLWKKTKIITPGESISLPMSPGRQMRSPFPERRMAN
jgi:hypothetical protein